MRGSFSRCDLRISLPSRIANRCLATARCPGCGRASCNRSSNAAGVPFSASRLIEPETSATRESRFARRSARPPTAWIAWVPFNRARPSFASRCWAVRPARPSASPLSILSALRNASPSPIMLNARCASGARSPLADRAFFRNDRMHATIQHCTKHLNDFWSHTSEAERKHVCAQQHHRTHLRFREWPANSAGVAANKVQLELAQRIARDANIRELAKTRAHTVNGDIVRDDFFDKAARGKDTRTRRRCDFYGRMT